MKLAIVQVRGGIGLNRSIKDTFKLLKLPKKHSCVLVTYTPSIQGMLTKIKDYTTWGDINQETLKLLLEKRGRLAGGKALTESYLKEKTTHTFDSFSKNVLEGNATLKDLPGLKPYFRLKPPTRGFERGGIKVPFSMGGVLGYRKDHINDLIKRML
ncbi:MAG TPA: 50S ribosomal protein L30 [Candidatus Nanoarchaeia archaeon]|nr:50S ribosomal protein L30 [Candidatus Nanoarchaeia archaeon]